MSAIRDIIGYELLDSRGNPTVGCKVITESGFEGFAIVPSGASVGKFEAFELRDGDKKRYFGKGVKKAIENIEGPLLEALRGKDVFDGRDIDETMIRLDGTENKSRLGANAILAISMAVFRCAASSKDLQLYQFLGNDKVILPTPMMNIINGGVHADNNLNFQEFMILPHGFKTFAEKIQAGSEVFHTLRNILISKGLVTSVGDEGGFAPNLSSTEEALDLIINAIKKASYQPGKQISLTIDCAASNFYHSHGYLIEKNHPEKKRSTDEQIQYLKELTCNYPITSIEDGLDENDWSGWETLTRECNSIQIVGDDLFVTNKKFLEKGVKNHCANSILIKLNQIGTVTETLDTIYFAKKHNYSFIISHRSGDTEDTFIADLAVATGAPFIKTGSMSRSERIAKYNRLLEIEKSTFLE
jgi:enolase